MIKVPQNKYKNKRCFIIASGPSVKEMDLSALKDEITICVNESYKALSFDPTYVCIGDRVLYPLIKDKLATMKSRIICSTGLNGEVGTDFKGDNLDAIVPLNKNKNVKEDGFIWNMKQVYKAWNVIPEIALPFVCWCGFSECYLIGCDCTNDGYFYTDSARGSKHQKVINEAMFAYSNISKMELPTKIYNATVGGRLECFPRVDYADAIKGVLNIKKQKVCNNILVIGYYTPDRNYRQLAERMKASVEKQGLECIIKERKSLASASNKKPMPWVLNCGQCPDFIQEMRASHPERPLLYLDADAVMEKRPTLFLDEIIDYDFAAPFLTNKYVKDELTSNTLFFNATEAASQLLFDWCVMQEKRNDQMLKGQFSPPYFEAWDQRTLQYVLNRMKGIIVKKLPYTYAKITVTPKGEELMTGVKAEDIVISQHQASRQNKVKV